MSTASDEYRMSEITDQIFAATTRIVSAWTATRAVAPNSVMGGVAQVSATIEKPGVVRLIADYSAS
jgi:hypothetical protein